MNVEASGASPRGNPRRGTPPLGALVLYEVHWNEVHWDEVHQQFAYTSLVQSKKRERPTYELKII